MRLPSTRVTTVSGVDSARSSRSGFTTKVFPFKRVSGDHGVRPSHLGAAHPWDAQFSSVDPGGDLSYLLDCA